MIFFPQRTTLRLNERHYSFAVQHQLTETAALVKSFEQAAKIVHLFTSLPICAQTIKRIATEVGWELVEERDQLVDDYTHHRQQPDAAADPKHDLVAVFVDGGRVQLRAEDQPPGVYGARWAEDKIARLQTFERSTFSADPCPELPSCFTQAILSAAPKTSVSTAPTASTTNLEVAPRWQPVPLVRSVVATMAELDRFRWLVQAEAKRRHFFTAQRGAFVADGSHGNWSIWQRHFPNFVPILDFVHAAEYLHAAAKTLATPEHGGTWAQQLWAGHSVQVIADLRRRLDQHGVGLEPLDEQQPLHHLQRAWVYLSNAADKLDYPRYRAEGLPTTSSLIESQIKEYNARLKGSEKFWHEANAEAMLQLVSMTLREDGPTLADYFDRRPTHPFRRKPPQPLAA